MSNRGKRLRAGLFGTLLPLATCLGAHSALASDPLPGDGIAPPVNVNIGLFYNQFTNAGSYGAPVGTLYDSSDSHNTHISTDITVLRYIRTFQVDGITAGAQIYEPYVAFLGTQKVGLSNIPSGLPAPFPALGSGQANLSTQGGFGQPNLSVFAFLVNKPATGTYFVVSPWLQLPISSFNKNSFVNPGQDAWVYEMEFGFRTTLLGTPTTKNLSVELWSESYLYGANNNSALVNPEVIATNIPTIYSDLGIHNPVQSTSSVAARFEEQPSQEFRIYLPYEFLPSTGGFVAPGFFQSFGGKQTYTLRNGTKVASGNLTNETQLRLVVSSFVSPTTQIVLAGYYDVAAHGGPLNRTVELRIAKFF
jgi:hypothetical protein